MNPTHTTFWNIPLDGALLYPLAALAIAIAVYSIFRRVRMWKMGKAAFVSGGRLARARSFVRLVFTDGLGHRRFLRDPFPGLMHLAIFWGFLVLFAGTIIDASSHYGPHYNSGSVYLWGSLAFDVLGLLVVVGLGFAIYRRYVQRPDRLDNSFGDATALVLIAVIVVSGYFVEGARLAVPEPSDATSHAWSPIGNALSGIFTGLTQGAREDWHRGLWYFHSMLVLGTIAYVAVSANKLSHIVVSTANTYFRNLGPKSVMEPIDMEKAETMGAGKIEDLRWKDILDLDSCTRCGRCQDNCPAYLSGKALSPKKVIQDLKLHWLERSARPSSPQPESDSPDKGIVDSVGEQAIWDCTSCRACEEQCPVYIEPLRKILEMRRYQALMLGKMPDTARSTLRNMQQRGHPWAGSQYLRLREDWIREAGLTKLAAGEQKETLFWVGCTAALAERNVKVTLAMVRLLQRANVDFGVLGGSETCCGDPARRLGYEIQFQEMALKNVKTFREHGIKRIITTCPHCFNVMKKEYSQFEGDFEVFRHSQVLTSLLAQGKLKVSEKLEGAATYHDPCYLGRYNDVYREPRRVLSGAFQQGIVEMDRSKWKSLCCGGGGGHIWMEENTGTRINEMRCEDVLKTGAGSTVTACPYCLQMFEMGIDKKGMKGQVQVLDIAEALDRAASTHSRAGAPGAERTVI